MKEQFKIINGDSLEILKQYPDEYFDSIVTDPPYGLEFMGKEWDKGVPKKDIWIECLRVLKKGGHLIAFAGTRTQHRMAVNIEDAGFEIRDMGAWLYGSGFPKSHNISKAIDKKNGNQQKTTYKPNYKNNDYGKGMGGGKPDNSTKPNTDQAIKWEGWGTALKPALEPFTIARKPFKGTVADNVLENGTGGINIDGCRIGNDLMIGGSAKSAGEVMKTGLKANYKSEDKIGRFPANLIQDGSQPIVDILGEKTKYFYCPKASKVDRNEGLDSFEDKEGGFVFDGNDNNRIKTGSGNIRNNLTKNTHPTVKPTDLMAYLCRLVTPEGGIILDPFCGSGSTGKAAIREGFKFIGVDLDNDYCEIAKARIQNEINK
jgi:DNA modification methylase